MKKNNTVRPGVSRYTIKGSNGKEVSLYKVEFRYKNSLGESKKERRRGFKTIKDAEKYIRDFKSKEEKTSDMKFLYLYNEFIEHMYKACTKANPEIKASSVKTKAEMLSKHIYPFFKDMPLNKIDRNTIMDWKDEMDLKTRKETKKEKELDIKINGQRVDDSRKDVPLAPDYLNRCLSSLAQVFEFAIDRGYIEESPTKNVKRFKNVNKTKIKNSNEKMYWNVEECISFLKESRGRKRHFYYIFLTLIFSGARVGEVLALRKKDIDFENETITIEQNASGRKASKVESKEENIAKNIRYKRALTSPKNGKSRTFHVAPTYFKEMKNYMDSLPELGDYDLIFTICIKTVQNTFNSIQDSLLNDKVIKNPITLHGLRHSIISQLMTSTNGEYSYYDISQMVGHSTTGMTEKYLGCIDAPSYNIAMQEEKLFNKSGGLK